MKLRLFLAVVTLQVLLLAFMAGQREWISRTGQSVVLRTAPVDPNDPMRGAFVRFDYEIGTVPATLCHGPIVAWLKTTNYREQRELRDQVVYAALKVNPYGLAELVSLDVTPPAQGLFLRGRIQSISEGTVHVRYGIEAMYMQKDAAQKLEADARTLKPGAPITTRVAVGSSGISVLKSYEWEPLGLTLAFDRPPSRAVGAAPTPAAGRPTPSQLTGLTVTLHNYGDHDLAVVELSEGRSFRLVPNTRWTNGHYAWARATEPAPAAPRAEDVFVLKPGATHQVHLNFMQPRWWVVDTSKPGSGPIPFQQVTDGWSASFRIEYAPPSIQACEGLPLAGLIRHEPLRSRAFNANQGVD